MNVQSIPIDKIAPPVWNSRTVQDKESDEGLASSLKHEGLKEPIKVRATANGGFVLIFGTRRLAAAKACGWKDVPAIVEPASPELAGDQARLSAMIDNVIENLSRRDLSTFDTARALAELRAPGGDDTKGVKLLDVVAKTGLSKGYISNLVVTFQKLDPEIKEQWQLAHGCAQLSFLRELAMLDPEKQKVAWYARVKLTAEAANEAPDGEGEDEDEEEDTGSTRAKPPVADKYKVEFDRYNKLVRALSSKKIPGSGLAVQCLKYLVGKQTKVTGIIEDPTTDE